MTHLMKLNNFSCITLLLTIWFTNTLLGNDYKEWGKVDPQYLEMTVYSEDTTASAIRIFDEGIIDLDVDGDIGMYLKRHYQIKILDEKGKDFADVAIFYLHNDIMTYLKAQVIQPNGEIIEVDSDNFFEEEVSNKYKVKKFTFPDVQVGSVLEVKYERFSGDIHELDPWYFHQSIPVLESEIIIHLSPFFNYQVLIANDPNKLVQHTTGKYYNRLRDTWKEEFRYKAVNLPAIKIEPYISCLDNYRANVNFQIKSIKYPGYYREIITGVISLCNLLLENSYEDFEEPDSETKDIVNKLVTPDMSNKLKAKLIFEYVRDSLTHDIGTSIYVRRDQEDIFEQKKASDTERNMLLKVMLQAIGLEATPLLISTRQNGLANPKIPFLSQYNKTILLINIDGEFFLFDARDPWVTYGQLPSSSLVDNALLVEKDNPSYISIPKDGLRSLEIIESHLNVSPEGVLSGNSQVLAVGYASSNYNKELHSHEMVSDVINERLADGIDGFSVINSDSSLTPAATDSFYTKFDFSIENFAEEIEGEIYLKPTVYLGESRNVFASEKRAFPIEFGYLRKKIETNYFSFPEGYSISELPKDVVIENDYLRFQRIIVKTQDNPLQIGFSRQYEIKQLKVPVEDYSKMRSNYAKIVDIDQDVIILKRTN